MGKQVMKCTRGSRTKHIGKWQTSISIDDDIRPVFFFAVAVFVNIMHA